MRFDDEKKSIFTEEGDLVAARPQGVWVSHVASLSCLTKLQRRSMEALISQGGDIDGPVLTQRLRQAAEDSVVSVKIFTRDDFMPLYRENENFCADLAARIKYFHVDDFGYHGKDVLFFVALLDNKIIGMAKLMRSLHATKTDPNWLAVSYLSVDPEYQNLGIASMIKEEVFRYVKENGSKLRASTYSVKGAQYLRELNLKLAEKYGVEFRDGNMDYLDEMKTILGRDLTKQEEKDFLKTYESRYFD